MHVRTLIIIVLGVVLVQYLLFNSKTGGAITNKVAVKADQYIFSRHRKLRVAVVNTQLSHDEVLVPLLDAWLQIPQVEVTTYQVGFRFGMDQVIKDSGLSEEISDFTYVGEFKNVRKDSQYPMPDVVVSTTCLKDVQHMNATWYYLLENYHTHFFCVFHHADQLESKGKKDRAMLVERLTPFIRAGRIDFVALSQHVADYALNDQFGRKWEVVKNELHHPPMHVFPPVFNFESYIDLDSTGRAGGFSVQGEYARGRDYNMVFKHLAKIIEAATAREQPVEATNVHLVGFGSHPEVPKELESHVIFDERLDYTDFYNTLKQTDAVLTAFSSDSYYLIKASSSVPAALIAGTPLIGNKRLLQTYQYLDESIVWMQEPGESDMDTVERVLGLSQEEKTAKKDAVREWTKAMVRKNRENVIEWTEKAVSKFPADWYQD